MPGSPAGKKLVKAELILNGWNSWIHSRNDVQPKVYGPRHVLLFE